MTEHNHMPRKRLEKKLAEAFVKISRLERELKTQRDVVETLIHGVVFQNRAGEITYANPAAQRILGLSFEQMQGRLSVDPRWRAIHEDGSEFAGENHPAMVSLRTGETIHDKIMGVFRPDEDRYVWISIDAVPLFEEGESNPSHVYSLFEDITENRQTKIEREEQRARAQRYLDIAGVIIVALDVNGDVTLINQKGCEILGRERDEIEGRNWFRDFVADRQAKEVLEVFRSMMTGKIAPVEFYENAVVTAAGEHRQIAWHNALLFDDEGRITGSLSSGEDVTQRRQMEEQLRQSEKMQVIGQLAGGVAHDFNNQLSGIIGFGELLKDGVKGDPTLLHFADRILSSADRAADLTNQLLAFSRKGKYLSVAVDLHSIVAEVIALLKRSIDKRIELRQSLEASPALTLGDPTQLQNAILNLALNARDAMSKEGVLSFETELVHYDETNCCESAFDIDPGDYVVLTVRDTGVGMDPETQRRIFEPFFTTKEEGQGVGMGLAAVYGTVKNHRGMIEVDSRKGQGTKVSVSLPLFRDAKPNDPPNGVPRDPSTDSNDVEDSEPRKRSSVLFVDDEQEVRAAVSMMLEQEGFNLITCSNGLEAVERYRAIWPEVDAVILDMVMPVMDGRQAFAEMRKINPDVVGILASGYSLDGVAQELMEAGALGFIQKPFRRQELLQKLRNLRFRTETSG